MPEPHPQELYAVVAVTENGVIGQGGALPWHLPADLAHFRRLTLGRPCVMGRKVWDSLGGRPLPGRSNIVLTRNPGLRAEGAQVVHSPEEALRAAGDAPEVAIIGGAEIYRLFWTEITRLELTRLHTELPGDTFFPAQSEWGPGWRCVGEQARPADEKNPHAMTFQRWERKLSTQR